MEFARTIKNYAAKQYAAISGEKPDNTRPKPSAQKTIPQEGCTFLSPDYKAPQTIANLHQLAGLYTLDTKPAHPERGDKPTS